MKKAKILAPLITLAGIAALGYPIVREWQRDNEIVRIMSGGVIRKKKVNARKRKKKLIRN